MRRAQRVERGALGAERFIDALRSPRNALRSGVRDGD
jgi:hypothetical protein